MENVQSTVRCDVKALRDTFRSGCTLSLKSRRSNLLDFQTLLYEGSSLLCEALWKDLHKCHVEAMGSEISLIQNEVQHHLDYLNEWNSPVSVGTDLLNVPGSSTLVTDPYGVVCIFGAWNYPCLLSLLPLVGALSAGNVVYIRLPTYSTESSIVMATLLTKYMNTNIVKVILGDQEVTHAVLLEKFDKIFFTGGTYVGKMVARSAAEHLCPIVLELGGKSPCVVDSSADIIIAARRITWGSYMNAGQTCVRPDYILVHNSIAEAFIAQVKMCIENMFPNPEESLFYGRIINARAHARLVGLLENNVEYIIHGGTYNEKVKFIAPTIMDFKNDTKAFMTSSVMSQEIFGPIMPIFCYENITDVIEMITTRPKPLAMYIFTTNSHFHTTLIKKTSSGAVVVNDVMVHMTNANLPFGGVGASGMGNYHGKFSFDTFSHTKAILYKSNYFDLPQRYPPYSYMDALILSIVLTPRPKRKVRVFQSILLMMSLVFLCKKVPWSSFKGTLLKLSMRFFM